MSEQLPSNQRFSVYFYPEENFRGVFDEDHQADVLLRVDGNFEDDEEKKAYCKEIVALLNRATSEPETVRDKWAHAQEAIHAALGWLDCELGDRDTGRAIEILRASRDPGPYYTAQPPRLSADDLERRLYEESAANVRATKFEGCSVSPPVTVPPLDDEVRWILGRPNFACISIAEGLRAGGYVVERKAEHEQAAVIHYMLSMYVKHGMDWRGRAENDLYEMRASVTKGIAP